MSARQLRLDGGRVWRPTVRRPEDEWFQQSCGQSIMDKKIKKKTQALHQRIQKLRQQLAGARKQADDPGEVAALEKQIAEAEAQVAKLKQS